MSDWNTKIIEEFRANGGKVGGPFEGAPMIIMHTIGAKSGAERLTPVVYFPQENGAMVVIASKAGAPTNPDWYHNIKANPRFDAEVGTETFPVDAAELTGDERERTWSDVVAAMPGFGEYQTKTTRVIPVLKLTRA
jgi:deazaflavin-dependent oxidoreductase (nitroreductase family)